MSGIVSATGCIMLPCAIMLDIIGIICLILDAIVGIGEIVSFLPDIIGIVFFGFWIMARSQAQKIKIKIKDAKEEQEAQEQESESSMDELAKEKMRHRRKVERAQKAFKQGAKRAGKRGFRFFLAALGELMPLLGALPFWTIFVISELRSKNE